MFKTRYCIVNGSFVNGCCVSVLNSERVEGVPKERLVAVHIHMHLGTAKDASNVLYFLDDIVILLTTESERRAFISVRLSLGKK